MQRPGLVARVTVLTEVHDGDNAEPGAVAEPQSIPHVVGIFHGQRHRARFLFVHLRAINKFPAPTYLLSLPIAFPFVISLVDARLSA